MLRIIGKVIGLKNHNTKEIPIASMSPCSLYLSNTPNTINVLIVYTSTNRKISITNTLLIYMLVQEQK